MEPDEETIARGTRNTGTTEQEARILYHLGRGKELFSDLPGSRDDLPNTFARDQALDLLYGMIALRVVGRDYEGWVDAEDEDR